MLRRTILILSVVGMVLSAGLWGLSYLWVSYRSKADVFVYIAGGELRFGRSPELPKEVAYGWLIHRPIFSIVPKRWWPRFVGRKGRWEFCMALWTQIYYPIL